MASSTLSNSFTKYFQHNGDVESGKECRQLMCVDGKHLFVWNVSTGLTLFVLADETDDITKDINVERVLPVNLTYSVCHDVSSVELSSSAALLSLAGTTGVTLVYLPRRIPSNAASIMCRSVAIDTWLFESNAALVCCKQRWLPNMDILFLLFSDNVLRVYDFCASSERPVTCCSSMCMCDDEASPTVNSISRTLKMSLGESVVSFAIGRKIEDRENVVPVFVLLGSGHVRSVFFDIAQLIFCGEAFDVRMQPWSRDNYGCDACDVLLLNAHIPVLAIADCSASIHLCIVLFDHTDGDGRSITLHVYETIQMERALSHVDLETSRVVNDSVNSALLLMPDPRLPSALICAHIAGIHRISMNWIAQLTDKTNHKGLASSSATEYIFCSKPVKSAKSAYPQGFSFVEIGGHQIGIALLADFTTCLIPLSIECRRQSQDYGPEDDASEIGASFIDYIKGILRRTSSNPIVKGGESCSNEKELAQLVTRCVQTLSKEHVKKIMQAKKACKERCVMLSRHREQQVEDVIQVEGKIVRCSQSLQALKMRMDDICEFQDSIRLRLNDLNASLNKGPLTPAEERLLQDLKSMDHAMHALNNRISQVQMNCKQMDLKANCGNVPQLGTDQVQNFFKMLNEQQSQLESLVCSVSNDGTESQS